MLNAKILAETEMNQHSGKILATIAFQIPVPANTNTGQVLCVLLWLPNGLTPSVLAETYLA